MANYVDKNAGDPWLAADGNALADDIGSPTTGHQHDGSEGHATLLPDVIGDGASITWDGRVLFDQGANIASGSFAIGTDGNYFHVTGTTTITALGTLQAGTVVRLVFDGALQITHNATSLILLSGANYSTTAGDVIEFTSEGSGNWRETNHHIAPSALSLTSGETDVATSETTTSASYGDLSTAGPAVTLSPGGTKDHMIHISSYSKLSGTNRIAHMSVAVSGASAVDADSGQSQNTLSVTSARAVLAASAADATAHTAKYKISAETITGTWASRRMTAHTL